MTAERDIAGFALAFASGTALPVILPSLFSIHFPLTATILLAITGICTATLSHTIHRQLSSTTLRMLITLSGLFCGAVCAFTSGCICLIDEAGGYADNIRGLGERLQDMIGSIPFENSQTNAIVKALICGERSELDPQTKYIFRQSGASHILALSGMHLGIIYAILKFFFHPIGNSRRAKIIESVIIMGICSLYTVMTGAGASIVRALIFIILGEAASLSGRSHTTAGILSAAMIIHLTICPEDIRNVGFQLSYAAMVGIAYIFPHMNRLWPSESFDMTSRGLRWIWTAACISIACQITTGPIAYWYFGTFPKYFILTNLMAVPLVTLIIPGALAVTTLHSLGICPDLVTNLFESLVSSLTGCLTIISSL